MVLPHGGIKSSSGPSDVRIYWKAEDGKVNRLKQPKDQGYPKFPKQDYKLMEREEAQFHFGRDFPTPEPTQFKAGVYGTVMYVDKDKVLVGLHNGNVIHYLHASEVEVVVGQSVTPDDVLGKTSNHLHIQATNQATNKDRKLLDVDQAFLAGREKPKEYTPFRIPRLDFVDLSFRSVGDKKPVVVDGVLQYEESRRLYYDESAVKTLGGTMWRSRYRWGADEVEYVISFEGNELVLMCRGNVDARAIPPSEDDILAWQRWHSGTWKVIDGKVHLEHGSWDEGLPLKDPKKLTIDIVKDSMKLEYEKREYKLDDYLLEHEKTYKKLSAEMAKRYKDSPVYQQRLKEYKR